MKANGELNGVADFRRVGADVPESDPGAKARARARLDRAIQRELTGPKLPAFPRWGAVAAAIVALSLLVSLLGVGGRPVPDRDLLELAAAAWEQPVPSIPRGSFVYRSARVRAPDASTPVTPGEVATTIATSLRERWIAEDGSGIELVRRIDPPSDVVERFEEEPGSFRFVELDRLPTEPEALFEALVEKQFLDDPDNELELLSRMASLFADSYASSAHRTAMFMIVAEIPGVTVAEGGHDPEGRAATIVSLTSSTRSVVLFFDPRTSRLLVQRDERVDGTGFETVYLETGVVSEVGERPEAGA